MIVMEQEIDNGAEVMDGWMDGWMVRTPRRVAEERTGDRQKMYSSGLKRGEVNVRVVQVEAGASPRVAAVVD
ncbi:uncharacterized protein ColSpa_07765 [Colletotrichum spaethianum]|uniref:Uncharacterized protein n=1 Tax=Colletotrichum spaethianum TaxID=700344 RepID=A0AA37P8H2_9PEZI|nr:uncharacterized protein ColSpa_07765 [Colletotrichum spaethianum]GKT47584.1 hypothetical protein ColSpa_07765 [Colletotrichum spaethianum]